MEPNQTRTEPSTAEIDAYLRLNRDEITLLILYLLVEDALGDKLDGLPAAVKAHAERRRDRTRA